jgi:hypothetical protein
MMVSNFLVIGLICVDYCKMFLCAPNGTIIGYCLGGKDVEPTTPFIAAMDVRAEMLTISNPLPEEVDISGLFVQVSPCFLPLSFVLLACVCVSCPTAGILWSVVSIDLY